MKNFKLKTKILRIEFATSEKYVRLKDKSDRLGKTESWKLQNSSEKTLFMFQNLSAMMSIPHQLVTFGILALERWRQEDQEFSHLW